MRKIAKERDKQIKFLLLLFLEELFGIATLVHSKIRVARPHSPEAMSGDEHGQQRVDELVGHEQPQRQQRDQSGCCGPLNDPQLGVVLGLVTGETDRRRAQRSHLELRIYY